MINQGASVETSRVSFRPSDGHELAVITGADCARASRTWLTSVRCADVPRFTRLQAAVENPQQGQAWCGVEGLASFSRPDTARSGTRSTKLRHQLRELDRCPISYGIGSPVPIWSGAGSVAHRVGVALLHSMSRVKCDRPTSHPFYAWPFSVSQGQHQLSELDSDRREGTWN